MARIIRGDLLADELGRGEPRREALAAGEGRVGAELLLDAQELVVLGHTLGTRRCTRLDLADAKSNDEVGDEGVLGLARAVGDHDTPAVRLRELCAMDQSSVNGPRKKK